MELDRLKKYWRKSQATVDRFHEDEFGVWVRVSDRAGDELTTHLISANGEVTNPDDGVEPYLHGDDAPPT
jgi:hypothetical protein